MVSLLSRQNPSSFARPFVLARVMFVRMSSALPVPASDDDVSGGLPVIDEAFDMRPILSDLGIQEVERGVCEDTYEHRRLLRKAKMNWVPVFAANGAPTGLIQARSPEQEKSRVVMSLSQRRPIMVDPDSPNSDYLTGLDLLAESASDYLVPPWVLGATKMWVAEQEAGGQPNPKKQPTALPHRCRHIKDDGIRCLLWSSGRPKDDGLCRVHLRSTKKRPGDDVERAREKLVQAAPYAVDVLEDLMENASSEPVRLKASTEILDRAGVRGGVELDARVEVSDGRPAEQVVLERLQRLAAGAVAVAGVLGESAEIVDAEVVEEVITRVPSDGGGEGDA